MILCGWLKRWWKESLQLMEGFDFTIIGIIRECLKLNMYPEAGEILSLDFRSVTDNKSFWSEYYEVRGQFYLDQSLYEKAEDAISKSIRLYRVRLPGRFTPWYCQSRSLLHGYALVNLVKSPSHPLAISSHVASKSPVYQGSATSSPGRSA